MIAVWGLLASAALLWPDHLAGPFDGIPLDRHLEAVAIGLVLPALWWFHPAFLRRRSAQVLIVLLCAWKLFSSTLLVQDGWCVRFDPARPYVWGQTGAPHAWDLRADWQAPDPVCSAIMTRGYGELAEFPAWFFNLPPPTESWPEPPDLPPAATVGMTVRGFLRAPRAGTLGVDTGPDNMTTVTIDDEALVAPVQRGTAAGLHRLVINSTLRGQRWRLLPTWRGGDVFAGGLATVAPPRTIDVLVRPWGAWVPTLLATCLLSAWLISACRQIREPIPIAWAAGSSSVVVALVLLGRQQWASMVVAALMLAAFVPAGPRLRNRRGAFVFVGVPWLAFVAASASHLVGRFLIYEAGNDFWMFQRFAYRIVMQGYWLEGGSSTFWFQPLYRWIAGLLHVVFGDSSVGEWYWDGACLLAGSLLTFSLVRLVAGFRWALVAAVLPLAVFVLGTAHYLIGVGLGEISSMGLMSAAALFALRSRHGAWRCAVVAGLLATLAFYVRLNNLPMSFGTALLALGHGRRWWRSSAAIVCVVALGVLLFAWRTWHYTGVFSVFYGTQRELLSVWQPSLPFVVILERMLGSVMMVLTVNDPARFDLVALPVLGGALVAVLAIARVSWFRAVPVPPVLFFFAAISGALFARGSAYPGRFSMHVLPVSCALAVCGLAAVRRRAIRQPDRASV
jgi:dolichyl-phosphate-mannose-protein mannosyltransferase